MAITPQGCKRRARSLHLLNVGPCSKLLFGLRALFDYDAVPVLEFRTLGFINTTPNKLFIGCEALLLDPDAETATVYQNNKHN